MDDPFEGINEQEMTEPPKKTKKKKKSKSIQKAEKQVLDNIVQSTAPEPKDDTKERAAVIFSIKSYGKSARFKKLWKAEGVKFGDAALNKMSLDALKLKLESLDMLIANRHTSDFIDVLLKNGLSFAENIIDSRTKFKIGGLAEELFDNDNFLDTLERLKLKYSLPSVNIDPGLEIMMIVIQTAMMVHQTNTFRNSLTENLDSLDLDAELKQENTD